MPKKAKTLTDVEVRRLRHGNRKVIKPAAAELFTANHAVGNPAGLLLQCRPPAPGNKIGSRSWILRTVVGGKRREFGLGGYPDISLATARLKAKEIKENIKERGIDPVTKRKSIKSALIREQAKAVIFEKLAAEYVTKKAKEFKTAKQVQKLQNHLINYAFPYIGKMIVADIERIHIESMLSNIWEVKTETANRLRLHVEKILDLATVKQLRVGDNPARWSGNLEFSFVAKNKIAKVRHYAALPVDDLPEFMKKLMVQEQAGAKALEFAILTAARSGEIRGATWEEIDTKTNTWVIPAERMKVGKAHAVPLSDAAIRLLEAVPKLGRYIFTGARGGQLADATVSRVPKLIGYDVTAHGFRSTFKDWCRKYTAFPDEVSELALAHVGTDATRAAYARDGLIDKRRLLMTEWADYCYRGEVVMHKDKVVSIGRGKS
jgi:integrase